LRGEIEGFVAEARVSGGVVLGRAGAVILADAPGALHVYLGGSVEARVRALMALEGIEREKAEHDVRAHDRARRAYVREAYGVDGDDPSLYHLMLDATALGPDACVELIVAASRLRMEA
jgi:cytidylate kinase